MSEQRQEQGERLPKGTRRTAVGIEPTWPTEHWWCVTCGESRGEDPCQFCGNPVKRYVVTSADAQHPNTPEQED